MQGETTPTVPMALLVAPDRDTRDLYAFALVRHDWKVAVAPDGAEGFIRAVSLRPDVVVTELMMPGLDGFELCRRLKNEPATNQIPLVVVTASAFPKDVERAVQSGGDRVICKPCLPADLVRALEEVLGRSRQARATSSELLERVRDAKARSCHVMSRSQVAIDRFRRLNDQADDQ